MAKYALTYGTILIVVGIAGYFITAMASWTALIPAILGAFILAMGLLGRSKPDLWKLWLSIALLFALIGFLGTVGSLPKVVAMFQGDEEALARRAVFLLQALTAVLTLAFIAQGIRCFIRAPDDGGV